MLHRLFKAAGLDERSCATLLGFNPNQFVEWSTGQRPLPESVASVLAAVLGVPISMLRTLQSSRRELDEAEITPAIWYKFRGPELEEADREFVVLIRKLGHCMNQLEEATKTPSVQWKTLFDAIRGGIDLQAPLKEQGRAAARIFRNSTALGHGAKGSGDALRGMLRALGILVVESPLKDSRLEGCSFLVGATNNPRPCVFANTHHVTWFRRNLVLMHEIGHAIFDAPSVAASLDFTSGSADSEPQEIRAQAFAQESLIPREVLNHIAQTRGIKWNSLNAENLAVLVAESQVELKAVIGSAVDNAFVTTEQADKLRNTDISGLLPELTDHALSTEQYLQKRGGSVDDWVGKRNTTLPTRSLRLPIGYVTAVVEACKNRQISVGKASELMMIDRSDYLARFGSPIREEDLAQYA